MTKITFKQAGQHFDYEGLCVQTDYVMLTGDHAFSGVWPVLSASLCNAVAALPASPASPTPVHPYYPWHLSLDTPRGTKSNNPSLSCWVCSSSLGWLLDRPLVLALSYFSVIEILVCYSPCDTKRTRDIEYSKVGCRFVRYSIHITSITTYIMNCNKTRVCYWLMAGCPAAFSAQVKSSSSRILHLSICGGAILWAQFKGSSCCQSSKTLQIKNPLIFSFW